MGHDLTMRAALRHTAELYAYGADRRDKAVWRQVLARDVIIEGPGFRAVGLEVNLASLDMLDTMFRATTHRIHNQVVWIDGVRAQGETQCTADHLLRDAALILSWSIRYQDAWRREDAAWLFTHRRLIVDWEETRPVTVQEQH